MTCEVSPALGAAHLMRKDMERLTELATQGNRRAVGDMIIYIRGMLQMLSWVAGDDDKEANELIEFVTTYYLTASQHCEEVYAKQRKGDFA